MSALSKNRKHSKLTKLDSIINGKINECEEDDELAVENLSRFKYAPIVFCDVKEVFLKYKSMLHMSFKFENLK